MVETSMKITIIAMVCLLVTEAELKRQQHQQQGLRQTHTPKPKHRAISRPYSSIHKKQVAERFVEWTPKHKINLWEISGQHEGDILIHKFARNGVIKKTERWPKGIIPYIISDKFSAQEKKTIEDAMNVFVKRTCVIFRPYKGDRDFIHFVSKDPGCFSFVGHLDHGQVVNFHKKCVSHGTIVHELLHVLGFYHQHSASERDDYIRINWNNIRKGRENQFGKNNTTSFGEPYDYGSVMHYSAYAFTKNNEATITPLKEEVEIGQRRGVSETDLNKVRKMYRCGKFRKRTQKKKSYYKNV